MNWNKIRAEYESTDITLKALAEKHDAKIGTVKSRKSREKWEKVATPIKKDATKGQPHRAPKGNKYAVGNRGNPNPTPKFSKHNTHAQTHGFFSKYMPEESLEIMEEIQERSPEDMIWDQIVIQYTAIIRAQRIMFVDDKEEMIKELKKQKDNEFGQEIEYEFQFAWDRHATFMNAQSRAMSELRGLIKQFKEHATDDDERRLKLEQMRVNVDKTKAEVDKIASDDKEGPIEVTIKRAGDRT